MSTKSTDATLSLAQIAIAHEVDEIAEDRYLPIWADMTRTCRMMHWTHGQDAYRAAHRMLKLAGDTDTEAFFCRNLKSQN
jgi:hypothetical protein